MDLYIYNNLSQNLILRDLLAWRDTGVAARYYAACGGLIAAHAGVRGFVAAQLLAAPPPYDIAAVRAYFERDVDVIYKNFFAFDWDAACAEAGLLPPPDFCGNSETSDYQRTLAALTGAGSAAALGGTLLGFFGKYACAGEARYAAFKWGGGGLEGIAEADDISFDDLAVLGYKKDVLIGNTEAFISGRPAHDVLLVGAAGTGKSSCIKAVFNMFRPRGLKLAELFKEDLSGLPRLMEEIRSRKQKYIVYIDDLSFDGSDADYKALKVTLDGQIGRRPDNMLLYATSNRSHLIRETWKDRDSEQDVHENETLHEKMSLSERFGIRLYFPVLDQREYFEIVALLLSKHGVEFNEQIGKAAVAWEIGNNGRSGRTAKQFVTEYLARG